MLPEIRDGEQLTEQDIENIIKTSLKQMNIEFEELAHEAEKELLCNFEAIQKQNIAMGNYIVKKGRKCFNQLGVFGKNAINFYDIAPIPVILGDDTIFDPYGGRSELNFDLYKYESTLKSTFSKINLLI